MFVRILFVFDFLFILFRITWWSSAGKELSSWFSLVLLLLYAVVIVCIPVPFGDWDTVWNSISSVPDPLPVIT